MRRCASAIAGSFAAEGLDQWIWRSVDEGQPRDMRFESLIPRSQSGGRTLSKPDVVLTPARRKALADADAITLNEVNERHGTGALCGDFSRRSRSMRAADNYGGRHSWEIQLRLSCADRRASTFSHCVRCTLGAHSEEGLLRSVPVDDLLTAIAVKVYDVPL
jgi:hypothetical protein